MQFTTFTLTTLLAASASAQYAVSNGTSTLTTPAAVSSATAPYPTSSAAAATAPYPSASGTVVVKPSPSGTGAVKPSGSSTAPFEGAAHQLSAGSALGLIVAGGVALML